MASQYYINRIKSEKRKYAYDVLLKEEVDELKHNIVLVVDDAPWAAFVHRYKQAHQKETVDKKGRKTIVGIHPLNDNLSPLVLKKLYNHEA